MGIYSESLKKREENNRFLEESAYDALIHNHRYAVSMNDLENTRKAIEEILHDYGVTPGDVRNCRSVEELLEALLDPARIMFEKISFQESSMKNSSDSILAFRKDGTPLVITNTIRGRRYFCPNDGTKGFLTGRIDLDDTAYVIIRPLKGEGFSMKAFVSLMFRSITMKDLLAILIAAALVSVLGLISPAIQKYVFGDLLKLGSAAYGKLISLGLAFVAAGILKAICSVVKINVLAGVKLRISSQIQTAIMAKILLMPYQFFGRGSTGKMSNMIRQARILAGQVVDFSLNNFVTFVFSLIYIFQMKYMSAVLLVPALIILLVQIILNVLICFATMKNISAQITLEQNENTFLYDVLKGIQKIKGAGAGEKVYYRMAENYRELLSETLAPSIWVRLSTVLISAGTSLGTLIILALAVPSHTSVPDYLAFTASFALLSEAVSSMVSMTRAYINMKPRIVQMKELFDFRSDMEEGYEYMQHFKGEIKAEHVSYKYDNATVRCLNDINLSIKAGEKVAIVGESGCGKSTFLRLLLGMLQPTEGMILYDGKPLNSFNQKSLRKRIGSVFQGSQVFPGTLADNIRFCAPDATDEDIWKAAGQAAVADDIRKLPMGMETEISEGNGGGFSGGQKQRILLARAFAQKPAVMFLDEATSALDNIAQSKVLQSVYHSKATVIMVAHRLSTVKDCDRIVLFKDGCIAEEGTYHELIAKNGDFAELVRKQM